uniref:Uncharacterized protein n=1 Tax=Romanomermis culicivorax TaxID=13658 RepID=A0A915JX08_ROMCU
MALLLHKVAHAARTVQQIWSNYQRAEHFMPNYLRSVAQQGKNPDLKDAMEQMQMLHQSEWEQIATANADCDKEILPQKSTNPLIIRNQMISCCLNDGQYYWFFPPQNFMPIICDIFE